MSLYSSLSRTARIGLVSGAVVILLATSAAVWWLMTPRQRLMFGNLREEDAAEIVQALDEWKVPYEIVDGGAGIAVADDVVYETRMRLVSANVPRGGHVGFELFDDADFGVTEFAQRVNYQRALQGEIERTIAALPGVETARVHLTIRRPGLLTGERETSKASVAVTLLPGETLTGAQVDGIRSLVAAAVEGLASDAVSVLDSNGALLAGGTSGTHGVGFDEREDEESRLETRLQARVVELLGQVLRDEDFRVSVDATLNFDAVREVNERPLAQAVADPKARGALAAQPAAGVAREEISRAPGRIERLSIAVIVPPQLTDAEVERIQSLIAAATGIDVERGDRIEVSRIGRQDAIAADAEPVEDVAPAPAAAELAQRPAAEPAPTSWRLLLAAALAGLALGGVAMFATRRRGPRALKAGERDALLAKMRTWLADGGTLS